VLARLHSWFCESGEIVEKPAPHSSLLLAAAVFHCVLLCCLVQVMFRVKVMAMRSMCVERAFLVVACFMVFCGFLVVRRCMPMMFCCLFMVVGALMLSHVSAN